MSETGNRHTGAFEWMRTPCDKKDCRFIVDKHRICSLIMPTFRGARCYDYTPQDKTGSDR